MMLMNGILALGALALAIPLAIHLLYRSRFKTVQWGAMHLLEPVVRINRRRIQWMHLLLLFLRCALPVLLAFCLARPLLTGFQALPGDAPQTIAVVVDDSMSMAAVDSSGVSRIEQAKQQLGELLMKMSRRDEVIWMPVSEIANSPSTAGLGTMGAGEANDRLRNLSTTMGPFDLASVIRAAVSATQNGSHPDRRVLIVSDFQNGNINDASIESLRTLGNKTAGGEEFPSIQFWKIGGDSEQLSNVSVEAIETLSPAIVPERQTRFAVRFRNASEKEVKFARVTWTVDGSELQPQTISIPSRSTAISQVTHGFKRSGIHEVGVRIEHPDALIEDNRRSIAVDVVREIDVLLVDGKPSAKPLEGQVDFLAIAMSPFAFAQQDQIDSVRAKVVSPNELLKSMDAQAFNIIVLANVAALDANAQNRLAEFVHQGGSMVLFDGEQIENAEYMKSWKYGETRMPLPAVAKEIVGNANMESEAVPMHFGDLNPQYAPWSNLSPGDQQPLRSVDVYAYRKLDPQAVMGLSENSPESVVLLSMSNGDPIVLSARRGRGRVIQFAIPANDSWTSLPLKRIYLPMMQQLALDLVGSDKATTVTTCQPMIVPISEFTSRDEAKDETNEATKELKGAAKVAYTVEPPGGVEIPLEPSQDPLALLSFAKTHHAGVYRFRQIRTLSAEDRIINSTVRVAEIPAEESLLRDMPPERLTAVTEMIGASVFDDLSSLKSSEQSRRFGREIWRWLLYVLLIAMILELVVQQQLVHRNQVSVA